MIVNVKTIVYKGYDDIDHLRFEEVNRTHCCNDMMKNSDVFDINDLNHKRPQLSIAHKIPDYDGFCTEYYNIQFCPFCGEKIEVKEIHRVRRIEEIQEKQKMVTELIRREVPLPVEQYD